MLKRQCIQSLTINSQAFISAPTVGLALVGRSVAWRRLDGCLTVQPLIIGNIDGFFLGFSSAVFVAGLPVVWSQIVGSRRNDQARS